MSNSKKCDFHNAILRRFIIFAGRGKLFGQKCCIIYDNLLTLLINNFCKLNNYLHIWKRTTS